MTNPKLSSELGLVKGQALGYTYNSEPDPILIRNYVKEMFGGKFVDPSADSIQPTGNTATASTGTKVALDPRVQKRYNEALANPNTPKNAKFIKDVQEKLRGK
jgi:hypothetical protein